MPSDKPLDRLPLRQLLASSDKCSRELHELVHTQMLQRIAEARELSRPVRRRSHYPTMMALQNGLRRLHEAAERTDEQIQLMLDHLQVIRDHGQREKTTRRR